MNKKTFFAIATVTLFGISCIAATQDKKPAEKTGRNTVQIHPTATTQSTPTTQKTKYYKSNPVNQVDTRIINMQRQMDQFFDDPFLNSNFILARPNFISRVTYNTSTPKVTFKESKDNYVMNVVTPGMNKKDLSIRLKGDTLTIAGKHSATSEDKQGNKVISQEHITSNFTQSFTLPENVDAAKITSKYNNGVLTITFPKNKEKAKNNIKTIDIQ